MGDRYELEIKCADCGTLNKHYHAESSGYMSFICKKCEKINWVGLAFVARIVDKKQEKRLYKMESFDKK